MLTSRRPWPGAHGRAPAVPSGTARARAAAARVSHSDLANAIRALAMDAVEQAKSGHPGLPMGAADIATVLFTQFLKFDSGRSATGPTATASCCRPATARCCSMRCCI